MKSSKDLDAALNNELAGHQLVFARTALEAIQALNARSFNGYVLDYWVVDWSGTGLCRQIRKDDPHGPIVFFSTVAPKVGKAGALRAGASAFLTADSPAGELRQRMSGLLALSEGESVAAASAAERVTMTELLRRREEVARLINAELQLTDSYIERATRQKALRVFIEHRGALGHFLRWWSEAFLRTCRTVMANTASLPTAR